MSNRKFNTILFGVVVGLSVLLILFTLWAIKNVENGQEKFIDNCENVLGGRYDEVHGYKNTDMYCLTDDGRILDME